MGKAKMGERVDRVDKTQPAGDVEGLGKMPRKVSSLRKNLIQKKFGRLRK